MPRRLRRQSAAFTYSHRLIAAAAAAGAALLLAPTAALAATSGAAGHGHSGLLSTIPIGSIFSISDDLATIAKDIFGAFVKALMPASLTKDGIKLLTWLAALPSDPLGQTYTGVGQLESDMRDVAVAFIPLTLSLSAARYTISGLTGGSHHPIQSVVRLVGASFCLIVWPWFFNNVTALINILTSTIFGFADVHHGLTVLWTTMFGGSAAFGDFAGFAEILIIGAIALVIALIILKVAILVLLAFLFVLGPLAIMLSPVPELEAITKLFGAIFTAAAIIPIGWAMMFALGGAFIGSATQMPLSFSGIENGFLALCAGLLCLFATLKWPTFIIGFAKSRLGAVAHQVGRVESTATGSTVRGGVAALPSRVASARSSIEAGGRTFARSLGAMGGAMGMPRGGAVGAASRLPGRALNARRQAGVAQEIKAGASASPAQAWEAMYDHTQRNATFTRPRPGAALKRGAAVAAATPTAMAASMGMRHAQARVTGAPGTSAPGASGAGATGASHGGGGEPRQPDVRFGTAHLDNARARAEVRSPSVRHELDADTARRPAPRSPASPPANPATPKSAPTQGNAVAGGSPRPQRAAGRQDFSAATPPSPTPRTARGVKGGLQRVRAATQRSTGTQKPLGAPARAKAPTAAPAPRQGAAPARSSRPAAPAPSPPAPVPASPAPSRPDPRSDQ